MEGVPSETEELLLTFSQSTLSKFDNHDVASSVSSGHWLRHSRSCGLTTAIGAVTSITYHIAYRTSIPSMSSSLLG